VAVAFAYLARVLGPQGYGNLEFTLAIIFFFTLLVDIGLSAYGAREIAKDEGTVPRLVAHITITRCLMAVGAFSILAILVMVIEKPWPVKQLILLYGLTLFGLPGILQWVFQGRDMMQYVAIASILRWSTFAAGVFLLIRGAAQLWMVALVEGIAISLVVFYYFWILLRFFGFPRQRIDFGFMRNVFPQALPIGASELVWAVKIYFATVLLGLVIAGPQVGWFGAAHRLVISLHTFVWLYFFNLLPSIARSSQGKPEGLHRLMRTSLQVTAWTAIFLGIVGTAFADPIITLFYGSQYQQSVVAFRVLIWVIPLTLISGHYRYTLIGYDEQRLEFLSSAGGAILVILLNLFLIPTYGFLGAAWSLVISEAFILGLAYYLVRRTITHIPMWSYIYRPLAAGAILIGALYLLPSTNAWVMGGAAVIVYGLALTVIQPQLLADIRAVLLSSRQYT
jgi:O-antigen/teichoic acid export membrane protein